MIDISTHYGSLRIKSPIVAGSSGLTDNINSLVEFERFGAGAVVLKSLFEEEILREIKADLGSMGSSAFLYPETLEFYDYFDGPKETTDGYLDLILEAKSKLTIPVIASINCLDAVNWTYFPRRIQAAGADALELNIFIFPADMMKSPDEYEKTYFDIITETKKQLNIPVFIKLSSYSTNLALFLQKLSKTGIDGMVLFNRFYNPDIDIEKLEVTSGAILSSPTDFYQSLRWIAIMAEHAECDLISSTGIQNSENLIKILLAGASATQVVSAFYQKGIPYLELMLAGLKEWMGRMNYKSLDEFRGKLCQAKSINPAAYSRIQFMKYFKAYHA
jgi:dihydroorotate dehydrogenase (fumarate)